MGWKIEYYESPSGRKVIENFIDGLSGGLQARVLRVVELLCQNGHQLGMPHSKSLGNGLFELRVRGYQEVRLFYIFGAEKNVSILHGFVKKTQATPNKELEVARKRQNGVRFTRT